MTLSYHAQYERADRLARLEEVLGFTNVVLEVKDYSDRKRYCVTSSGIVIVKAMEEDFVITAYMITVDHLYHLCMKAGKKQMPPKLYKRVCKNMERHRDLYYI